MKIKLTRKQIETLANSGEVPNVSTSDPWWVIVLKVIAYIIGLVLAGYATPAAVSSVVSGAAVFLNIF